jgi:bacteriorhodopsin
MPDLKKDETNKKVQPVGKTVVNASPGKAVKSVKSVGSSVVFTFMITYTLLLTTATITLIEALRTKVPLVRHILNLETCISVVASYYYGIFITKVQDKTITVDWSEITKLRYIDWSITTPMMLVVLALVLGLNSKKNIHFPTIAAIIFLNYCMLFCGYQGEVYPKYRLYAMIGGFIPFFVMFYLIYRNFYGKNILANKVLFFSFVSIWALYGIVYILDEITKNTCLNVLDLISKCFVGIGLWAYYAHIIVV